MFGALVDIGFRSVPTMLCALGMTFVIGTRGVDLSVGSVASIASVVAALGVRADATSVASSLALALTCGVALGLFNGLLVARLALQPILATLVLFTAGRGLAQMASDGNVLAFDAPGFAALASSTLLGLPNPLWIALVALGVLVVVATRTAFGLYVQALGDNPRAARLAGLPVTALTLSVYGLSGACAALAGALVAADVRAADASSTGLYFELDAILATVIGGTSLQGGRMHLVGSACGALLLQTLTTTAAMHGAATEGALLIKAVAVLAVCAAQSGKLRASPTGARA